MPKQFLLAVLFCVVAGAQALPPCTIHTVIGDPVVFSGDGGPAVEARLLRPGGVARGPDGSIYVADTMNHRIRKIDSQGIIRTIAGMGTAGRAGDGGPAMDAQLSWPSKIEVGLDGSIYFIDNAANKVIRRIRTDGIIETVAGNYKPGETAEDVRATKTSLSFIVDFALSPSGEIYIPERDRILRVDGNGIIRRVNGGSNSIRPFDGPPLSESGFYFARHLHFAADGTLFIADSTAASIFIVGADGLVKTLAGNGRQRYTGDGPVEGAGLANPNEIITSSNGAVYFQDGPDVRRIANGMIETLPQTFPAPSDWAAGRDESLFIASGDSEIFRVGADFNVIAISGRAEDLRTSVPLNETAIPNSARMAVNSKGTLFLAGSRDRVVYRVGETIEVYSEASQWPDAGTPPSYLLQDISIDRGDHIYLLVSGSGNAGNRVFRLDSDTVTRKAGGGSEAVPSLPAAESNVDALSAVIEGPTRIAAGENGEIYVAARDRVLHINAQGRIGALAIGQPTSVQQGQIQYKISVADMTVAGDQTLYVLDTFGYLYRYPGVANETMDLRGSALTYGPDGSIFVSSTNGLLNAKWGSAPRVLVRHSGEGFAYGEGGSPMFFGTGTIGTLAYSPSGDIYSATALLRRVRKIVKPFECTVSPDPKVNVTVNGASYRSTDIAPGTIVSLFGENLGPAQLAIGGPGPAGWTTETGGLQVYFDGIPAPVIFSRADQSAAIVPYEIEDPVAEMRVDVDGLPSLRTYVNLKPAAPGIFTLDASGQGQAAALNQNLSINGPSNRAAKGSIMVLYMTGGGRTEPANHTGAITGTPLPRLIGDVMVRVGSQEAEVLYAGGAPGLVAGVEQVNYRLPNDVASGDSVGLSVGVGTNFSNQVTVAIE